MDLRKMGKFIAELRKNKKITQEQLAERLGVNNRTISRWETGKNMPDVSLYKPLCEILEISVEELINGEKTNTNYLKQSFEKAIINTIDTNEKTKKKMNKLIKILFLIILVILMVIVVLIIYYNNKYPKIDIYNMSVLNSDENKLNNELTLYKGKYKVWFYGIESLQLGDSDNNYFDLKNALKYKQVAIDDVKNYLEVQYNNDNIKRYVLLDGEIKIYKTKKFEAIVCNTIDGNEDIYFGALDIASGLKGEYCGKKISDICYFTRTYYVLNITDDDDYNFINVTLRGFQGETAMVRIDRNDKIQVGKNYEFIFSTYEIFDNNISNIFENSKVFEINETSKVGLEQINEEICVNAY